MTLSASSVICWWLNYNPIFRQAPDFTATISHGVIRTAKRGVYQKGELKHRKCPCNNPIRLTMSRPQQRSLFSHPLSQNERPQDKGTNVLVLALPRSRLTSFESTFHAFPPLRPTETLRFTRSDKLRGQPPVDDVGLFIKALGGSSRIWYPFSSYSEVVIYKRQTKISCSKIESLSSSPLGRAFLGLVF